ncbi:hypothetical protein LZ32DRAFT_693824 [Colletotrichum eremochloae]|nr:hypothetical protein LZ32DRAFT_693824 [Colletotrichum eremochloae]
MKTSAVLLPLAAAALAGAADISSYQPAAGVDPAFRDFLVEFYAVMEDQTTNDTFTDFWPSNGLGEFIYNNCTFPGPANVLGIKQVLVPRMGDTLLWHLIRNASVIANTAGDKTYQVDTVIQTSTPTGNCSQAYGDARFTILKDAKGVPRLTPHTGGLSIYNLTVTQPNSPSDIACALTR